MTGRPFLVRYSTAPKKEITVSNFWSRWKANFWSLAWWGLLLSGAMQLLYAPSVTGAHQDVKLITGVLFIAAGIFIGYRRRWR